MRASPITLTLAALALVAAMNAPAASGAAEPRVKRPAPVIKMRQPKVSQPKRIRSSNTRSGQPAATNPDWVVTSPEGKKSRIWGD